LLSAGAFVFAAPAFAQPTQDTVPTQESPTEEGAVQQDETAPEEGVIIVTAQGRAQALQDVPLAVSAVNQEQLQNSGATDIRALNQLAPSLLVSSTGSEANGSARIRGIGTVGDNPGLESSVAVFIDGVYRSRSGIGLNELGEVDRIEVLRGPQGTLFGRNASAGLIHVITRKPEFTLGGMGELTYGNYNFVRAQGAITGPLSDTIAARLDAVYVRRDGFYDVLNPTGGTEDEVNDRNRFFGRAQLLIEPNDALSIRLIGDYTWRDESCCGAVYIENRETVDGTPTTADGGAGGVAFNATNRIVNILTSLGAQTAATLDPFSRVIEVSPGRTFRNETTDWGLSAQVDYDFGNVSLTSITAYRQYKSDGAGDIDYGRPDILYRPANGTSYREFKTLTQEIRLQGSAFDDRLDWLVGAYFAQEDLTVGDSTTFGSQYGAFAACRLVANINPALVAPTAEGCITPGGRAAATPGLGGAGGAGVIFAGLDRLTGGPRFGQGANNVGDVSTVYRQDSQNYALFTHNIFNVTDTLSLTLGARYTHETKEFDADFNNNNSVCPVQQATGPGTLNSLLATPLGALAGGIITLSCVGNSSTALNALDIRDEFDDSELSGTAVLTWRPSRGNLFYGSYSRGYKAGGYNLDRSDLGSAVFPRSNANAVNLRFAAEVVDAYELGAKFTRPGFTFNVAAFHQRFRDFQLNTFNGTVFIVQNINGCTNLVGGPGSDSDDNPATGTCAVGDIDAGVTTTGIELEAVFNPSDDITISAGYTYADTKYADDLAGSNTGEALDNALFLLPGDNLSNAPEHVVTGAFSYTPEIGSSGLRGLLYVDGRWTGAFNTGSDLFIEKEQDSFFVMNARIGIRGPDQRWAIELWSQNLLNEDYYQVAFNTPVQGANSRSQVAAFGAPGRTTGNQLFSAFLAEPRTFGLTGRIRF
jgi:outer membrane receptor protein involved in Fe transport